MAVEYTGNYRTVEGFVFGDFDKVNLLECVDKSGSPQGTCFRCGKALRRHWFTVQTVEDDFEICNMGVQCVKKVFG